MDRNEAALKLIVYHQDFGDWIFTTPISEIQKRIRDYKEESRDLTFGSDDRRLKLLGKSVQLEAVVHCRSILGDEVPPAPKLPPIHEEEEVEAPTPEGVVSMRSFRKQSQEELEVVFTPEEEEIECQVYNMLDLTKRCVKPRYEIGDPAWIADWDGEQPVGWMPVIITGLECYPDEVIYLIGHYDEETGLVTTNFEAVTDSEIFNEPGEQPAPPRKQPTLSVVKN